jgi:glycosyltransferase involved in cell wall biosynthesis
MRVTALVPTFNRSGFLKEALSSLLRQTLPPDEIIVIDDGSTDDTAQVVASFAPAVRYISKVNGGKSSALNLGLEQASGELIYILDDDDIAADDALERMSEALSNNPEFGFVYAEFDTFRVSDTGVTSWETRAQPPGDDELYLTLMHHNRIVPPSMLVRKSCFDHVGPFNEDFIRSQDYEMLLRLVRVFKGKRLNCILSHIRHHTGMRGTAAVPLAAKDSYTAWRDFDTRAISAVYHSYDLKEFLPQPVTVLSNQDRFTALLQRCVIVGRKKLWNLATNDLREACDLATRLDIGELTPAQSLILRRLFDISSHALHDLAAAEDFRSVLLSIRNPTLANQIRAALISPILEQVQDSLRLRAARTSLYLIACLLFLSPLGLGINHLGDKALKKIDQTRSAKLKSEQRAA